MMSPDTKIVSLDEISSIIGNLKKQGKKVVQCHGVFDLLHPGHMRHFESARRQGDVLVVTLTPDRYVNKGPGRPVFNQRLRAFSIASLQCVDYVAVNEWPTAVETIVRLKPDIYAKGSDYADRTKDITGMIYEEERAVESVGGKIHFTDEITFSSTRLLNTFFDVYPETTKAYLDAFRMRYSPQEVIDVLQGIRRMKVLIIGDAIIDEYHYTQDIGKASKDSMLTTKYISSDTFAGGVLAVANHVAGFCDDVSLVTCLGEKETYQEFIASRLRSNVRTNLFYRPDAQTTVKRRFVSPGYVNKLFEVCFLSDNEIPKAVSEEIARHLNEVIGDADVVIVPDFGHGLLVSGLIEVLSTKSKHLALNTQTNSANLGFNLITRYPRADYICINEPEIRYATHDRYGDLEGLTSIISQKLHCHNIITTCGPRGCLVFKGNEGYYRIPAFSGHVVDRVGASDSFFAVTSPCVANGAKMDVVGFIGNAVAGLKVGIVGNRSAVEPTQLFKFVNALLT